MIFFLFLFASLIQSIATQICLLLHGDRETSGRRTQRDARYFMRIKERYLCSDLWTKYKNWASK